MNALTEIIASEDALPVGVEFHEYAGLFPWIKGAAFDELKSDIAANGVREPIVFFEGQILDGRNRYLAARELGIEFPRTEYTGHDPLGFVVSLNLQRRHLTEAERSMLAAKLSKMPRGRPSGENPPIGGITTAEAAAMMNTSVRGVERARAVQDSGADELIAAVDAGKVSVSAAAEVAKLPIDEQKSVVEAGEVAIKGVAKIVREEGASDETLALREAVVEAAKQGLKPEKRKSRRNPDYEDDPAYKMLLRIVGPSRAMAEQVERGEIVVDLALKGFLDAGQRERALEAVTQARDFLTLFLETANAH